MILGIDATNLRQGGGVTHLKEILNIASPNKFGFTKVIVWSNQSTLNKLDNQSWLVKVHDPIFEANILHRSKWQYVQLANEASKYHCNLLFAPGGNFTTSFRPIVTMCRNMLVFESSQLLKYKFSATTIRLLILRLTQAASFRKSSGLIFLTRYAYNSVNKIIQLPENTAIIPHGVNQAYFIAPRNQKDIQDYNETDVFRIIYVSIIDVYKNQDIVTEAVFRLRTVDKFPVSVEFVGPAYLPALKNLRKKLSKLDPFGDFIKYKGPANQNEMIALYKQADLCVFASSCENMPNILLEGMASGTPIASSAGGPMKEILRDGGEYFDPEVASDVYATLKKMIVSAELRSRLADRSFKIAAQYSWQKSSNETFAFLSQTAKSYQKCVE